MPSKNQRHGQKHDILVKMILCNQVVPLYFMFAMQTFFYTLIFEHSPGPGSITQVVIEAAALSRT